MKTLFQLIMGIAILVLLFSVFKGLSAGLTELNLSDDGYGAIGTQYGNEFDSWRTLGAVSIAVALLCWVISKNLSDGDENNA